VDDGIGRAGGHGGRRMDAQEQRGGSMNPAAEEARSLNASLRVLIDAAQNMVENSRRLLEQLSQQHRNPSAQGGAPRSAVRKSSTAKN
jgi:hypothetical protein